MKRSAKIASIIASTVVAGVGVGGAWVLLTPTAETEPVAGSSSQAPTHTATPEPEPPVPNAYNPGKPESCSTWSAIRFKPHEEGETTTTVRLEGPELTDVGAREFAAGEVTRDADGRLATYTVAAGDAGLAIGERFCVDYITVLQFNRIGPIPHPGDVLVLHVDESVPFPIDGP